MSYHTSKATARTTRRQGITKAQRRKMVRKKPPKINSRAGLKKVNKEREKIGLPKLELKSINIFHDSQWVTKSGSVWSFIEDLNTVAVGDSENERESNKIRFLPKDIRVRLKQSTNESFDYRIMLIKQFDKVTTYITPDDVFNNTTYWSFCTYKKGEDRAAGTSRFKVLYDKQFRWSTVNGNSTAKFLKIHLPTANVDYDDDVVAGTAGKNRLILVAYTDATASSAAHEISMDFYYEFLDQ